ncbi:MAG: FkbM family methyltransferase [Actinomycetota bacterium]|nr:FkbM family methyltransferase [Actinomycetota bacterium]
MSEDLSHQLELLLSESYESVIERAYSSFDRMAAPVADSVVLFGAGGMGRRTLAGLRSLGIPPVAFSDNNPDLWNTVVDGIPVLSPEAAALDYGDHSVFLVTILHVESGHPVAQVEAQLNRIRPVRVISVGYLYWKYPSVFGPYFFLDSPGKVIEQADQVSRALDLWADETSRAEYVAQIRNRLWLDWEQLPPGAPDQYFPSDLPSMVGPDTGEVFVDCGAFDGDTIRMYLERRGDGFAQIHAFEPDPVNFALLSAFREALPPTVAKRIDVLQAAVSGQSGTVSFDASGSDQSRMGVGGATEVPCVALDDVLKTGTSMYIKMDVEGAEFDALCGAGQIIKKGLPRLAVCVYHTVDHLWRIPNLLASMSSEYSFYLRRHRNAGWETVCYAVHRESRR